MTENLAGTQILQEIFQAQIVAQELPECAIASAGNVFRSTAIEVAMVQAAMQPWVEMECYQLSQGKLVAQMDSLDLGSQQVVVERQEVAVQKLGIAPPNFCTVSCCTPDPTSRFSELCAADADSIFFMPGNFEFDIYVPAGVQTAYVSFNQDEFLAGARALNPADWERAPSQLLSIHTTQQAAFKNVVNQFLKVTETFAALDEVVDTSVMQNALLQNILQIAVSSGANESRPSPIERSRAFQICRMARIFVEDSLAADILPTIVDICTAVGVSERALQYAFRTYVDMSPQAYLRISRLNRVRETLLASDPQNTTVTAVAMRFGFLHLSRFAFDYKRIFDELPSATLAS